MAKVRKKEEGRRKKEEGRRKREEERGRKATLARKKPLFPVDIHPWVYTNDLNGHDIRSHNIKGF
ncbi:hypothetical protein [Okeania sp. KiyG1]|uniref:hypothetical protein n=1 Tax=Okeania sp. KiyG1 TaxID=2720165 RepID=UPI0019228EE4|nr:hypothetical protein [Okeania sp. KiyG1]GFZ94157.1 hypothetical protein CYANOKiyG1_04850 [Okeania sp. KiyG1]